MIQATKSFQISLLIEDQSPASMSQRKRKATNKPSLSNPLSAPAAPSSLELTAFHPSKPLYAVASTAIGQNVIRIFDVDRPVPGAQEARSEIRLKKNELVSCLSWAGFNAKGQKKGSSKVELVVGLSNGRIFVVEEALGEIVKTFEGHTAAVRGWTTDGNKGWTCGNDAKLRLWDLQSDTCLQ
jgi:WD40 repeat protein